MPHLLRTRHLGSRRLILALGAVMAATGLAACSSSSSSGGSSNGGGTLSELQNDTVTVVQKIEPSVVRIDTTSGLGSGIVYDDKGDIVTNAHVVGDATTMKVTATDGHEYDATLVYSYVAGDLAVIKVSGAQLHPATFADSSKVAVGDFALAMGSPLGLTASVTQGVVSALDRTLSEGGGVAIPELIQTSAAINPGNSGGALVDLNGAVVGVNTLAATSPSGGQAPGIGFAINSNMVKDIAGQIVSTGKVTNTNRAYLGAELADATASGGRASGAYVVTVEAGGPAAGGGIVAGDVITGINGTSTPNVDAVALVLASLKPGQTVPVGLTRAIGSTSNVAVTMGELPG